MKRAALFPGQGAQHAGMGQDLALAFPEARTIFEHADEVLGFPLSETCFAGSAETVNRTDVCQPGIYVVSVATIEVLRQRRDLRPEDFAYAAGLSLGEYTALWFAGAVSFEDGLTLTRLRGELMQAASEAHPSGMVSILGLEPDVVEAECEEVRSTGGIVCVANLNCPGQVVVSGEDKALSDVSERLRTAGARRVIPLSVAGAFHSPLMAPAADGLKAKLLETPIHPARIPVVANVSAHPVVDPDEIREGLARQLVSPVLWERSVKWLLADGCREFLEPGPRTVLAGLMKKIDRSATVVTYPGADSIQKGEGK